MKPAAYYNSHDLFFRNPFGAVVCGQTIDFRILVTEKTPIDMCFLRLWVGEKEILLPMRETQLDECPFKISSLKEYITEHSIPNYSTLNNLSSNNPNSSSTSNDIPTVYEVEYTVPDTPGLIWYYFILTQGAETFYYGNNSAGLGGEGEIYPREPPGYQITVYLPMQIPEWFKRGVIYQLYVDRFYNGNEHGSVLNPKPKSLIHGDWYDTPFYIKDAQGRVVRWDFFGGNLQGIIQKLPYLQELGISILYLNPIFESPSNHKYDTADYKKIDPMYGDQEIFERLVQEAKRCGIRIILDGVFSHTGSDSIYFNKFGHYPDLGAYQSPESPYFKWYKFKESGEYACWWGVEDLPEVDELEESYLEFILGEEEGVVPFWMKKGVKGWRLDVVDELPDPFIQKLRQVMKNVDPEAVLIGEVWEDASNKVSYGHLREYFWGNELDSVMNYPFREIFLQFFLSTIDARQVHQRVMSLYENYPRENFFATMNLIGSHDQPRILTLLGKAPPSEDLTEKERETFRLSATARQLAVKRLKLLTLIQMTFPGVPSIYYGDEAGLEGYADPYNRGTYPWGREDPEILYWTKRILRLRQEYEVFQSGDFFSFALDEDLYGFVRSLEDEAILVLVNRHPAEGKSLCLDQIKRYLTQNNAHSKNQSSQRANSQTASPFFSPFTEKTETDGIGVKETKFCTILIDLLEGLPIELRNGNGEAGQTKTNEVQPQTIEVGPLTGKVLLWQRKKRSMQITPLSRSCGILLHVSSLPSPWGIGDLGEEAYRWIDFLVETGQSIWQVLPLNPVGLGDSPYQSDSAFAGNELLISIDHLIQEGLLSQEEANQAYAYYQVTPAMDGFFTLVKKFKSEMFLQAFKRFKQKQSQQQKELQQQEQSERQKQFETEKAPRAEAACVTNSVSYDDNFSYENFRRFRKENQVWLEDFALYRALKDRNQELPWYKWEPRLACREEEPLRDAAKEFADEIEWIEFVQYTFFYQWQQLKKYANDKGIKILGDLPIFVAADSSDTWANRQFFALDEKGRPAKVAGVPPDYFSETGQLWGNPVYDWERLAADDYSWWKHRMEQALKLYDAIRLDHFRGFEAYWEIPAGEKTAVNGRWMKGPGKRFFESLTHTFGALPVIAEDLGVITNEVNVLKSLFGFPGMKVFQFTPQEIIQGEANTYDANNSGYSETMDAFTANTVLYSGTHDNDTLLGWYKTYHKENSQCQELFQSLDQCQDKSQDQSREHDPNDQFKYQKERNCDRDSKKSHDLKACREIIETLYRSNSAWVILPLQDILGLDSIARMNIPGTVEGNWQWRFAKNTLTPEIKKWLKGLALRYKRAKNS